MYCNGGVNNPVQFLSLCIKLHNAIDIRRLVHANFQEQCATMTRSACATMDGTEGLCRDDVE